MIAMPTLRRRHIAQKFTLIFLIAGCLCLNSLFPSPIFFALGFIGILFTLISNYKKVIRPDDYLLIILSVSFFDYSSSRGGLWNYINFFFLVYLIISGRWKPKMPGRLHFILPLFLIITLAGLIFINPAEGLEKISFFIVFASFVLSFLFACQVRFTLGFFQKFSKVLLFIVCYQFLICLNQRFEFFDSIFPFFPTQPDVADYDLRDSGLGVNKVRNWGSVSNFELFAEINSMVFVFYVCCFSIYDSVLEASKLRSTAMFLIVFSLLNILLSGTRSSLIIILMFVAIVFLFRARTFIFSKKWLPAFILVALMLFVFSNSVIKTLGLETLVLRLNLITRSEVNLYTGAGMNRQGSYQLAFERISEESLIIGNGYSFGQTYSQIMKGDHVSAFIDFHSLYLSLPFFYGWPGSFLFLLVLAIPLYVLYKKKGPLWIAFFFLWAVFFINEYKIQFIRDPHYTMIIWILLGITYSFMDRYKRLVKPKEL